MMVFAALYPSYETEYDSAISRLKEAELASMLSLNEGAGKTGCALHPRSRMQLRTERRAHEQPEHSGILSRAKPNGAGRKVLERRLMRA